MRKRFLSLLLLLSIFLALLPTAAFAADSATFTDVPSTAWYHDAVDYVSSHGIMSGQGDNSFSPDTQLTRAQLCQILYNIEGKPNAESSSFSDVSSSDWYSDAVNWAAAQGIVNGTGNGLFSPNSLISREQMVTILYRYAAYKNYTLRDPISLDEYSDANLVNSWAKDAMGWAVGEGIISGTTAATISPQGSATRAQAATMLMRFCQRMEAAGTGGDPNADGDEDDSNAITGICGIPYVNEGKNVIWKLNNGTLTISGTGEMEQRVFGDSFPWRSYRDTITSVVIGEGVTDIGMNAFRDCTSLTSVTIGDSVTTIYNSAFSGCTSLTSVTIGDSVIAINHSAFSGCTSLTDVIIPSRVTYIANDAFLDTPWLEKQGEFAVVNGILVKISGTGWRCDHSQQCNQY